MENENKKVKAFEVENISDIKDALYNVGVDTTEDELSRAFDEAAERYKMVGECMRQREENLVNKYGVQPMECHNEVCPYCKYPYGKYCFCNSGEDRYLDCNCRLLAPNPNTWDYDEEYLPTWQECLDIIAKNGLIKEDTREECRQASLDYGKCKTQKERGNTEIKGITMDQARAAIRHAIEEMIKFKLDRDFKTQEEKDEFESHIIDPDVMASNATLEFEKIMGIYPNIKMK